jgi:hypothetical protein
MVAPDVPPPPPGFVGVVGVDGELSPPPHAAIATASAAINALAEQTAVRFITSP